MDTKSARVRLCFGPFELDRADGELYRDGRPVHLQEHPRQVLLALLERPGEIVTREDLRERLWKSDTFVDFEHGLNTAVKKARQALGDSADTPAFIETVARRGYRFIGAVSSSEAQVPMAAGGRRAEPASVVWGIVLVVAITGTVTAWILQRHVTNRTTLEARPTPSAAELAVMPLRVLSDAPNAYLGVGIADAITTRLANTGQISLRPTSAVLPYKDAQSDPIRVAKALSVQHLLLGTIQPTEETYRVSLQLTRADGIVVWGQSFDQPRATLLHLQDSLVEQVVWALRVELSAAARAKLRVRYTDNPAAHDLYLRGRSLMVNYTEANMREAIRHFERALEIDQRYALARAGIATASAWFSVRYAHDTEALTWAKRADEEARRALEQDGSLADAHFAIACAAGTLYGGFAWNVVLDRTAAALAIDPSLDLAHLERMRAYYHLGLFEEARKEEQLARAVNPNGTVALERMKVALDLYTGRFADAAQSASNLLAQTDAAAIRHYLAQARYYMGDAAGAREVLAPLTRGDRPDLRAQAVLASFEAAVGMRRQAEERMATVIRGSNLDHHVAYSLGAAFAQLGDADASVVWLERAATTGLPCYPWFQRDPLLDPVRQHAGFVQLINRLKFERDQARTH